MRNEISVQLSLDLLQLIWNLQYSVPLVDILHMVSIYRTLTSYSTIHMSYHGTNFVQYEYQILVFYNKGPCHRAGNKGLYRILYIQINTKFK